MDFVILVASLLGKVVQSNSHYEFERLEVFIIKFLKIFSRDLHLAESFCELDPIASDIWVSQVLALKLF